MKQLIKLSLIGAFTMLSLQSTAPVSAQKFRVVFNNEPSCNLGGGLLTILIPTNLTDVNNDLRQVKLINPGARVCRYKDLYIRVSAHQDLRNAKNLMVHIDNSLQLKNKAILR
jgi:hypothetical protein